MPGGPKHFSEVVETPGCLSSLYIFLYDFYKTTGVPEGPKHFSEVLEDPEFLSSLKIFLYDLNIFLKL